MVRERRDAHEPPPPVRPGDQRAGDRARHRHHRHDSPGGSGAGRRGARADGIPDRRDARRDEALVPAIPRMDHHAPLRHRRAQQRQQPQRRLGLTGGGIRAARRRWGEARIHAALLSGDASPATDGRRWQLPARAGAHQTLWLLAVSARRDGNAGVGALNAAAAPVGVHDGRRVRDASCRRVYVPVHQGQARLAKTAGRDVLRPLAGAPSRSLVWRAGAARAALPGPVEDAAGRSDRGRGRPELSDSPTALMALGRSRPMTTRREFLETSAAVLAARYARLLPHDGRLPLGFSTLGCPAWTWSQILDFAAAHGYVAVELRGLQTTMDLSQAPELAPGRLEETKRQLAGHGLSVSDLGASAQMHEMDPAKRAAQLAEARRFIDLAQALGAPYVRVFGNNYVKDVPRADMLAHIARGLRELGDYAQPKGVTVLLESHGDFTDSPSLLELLRQADSPAVQLLWDAHHTFVSGKEQPEDTVRQLGRYIRHTHLKDSVPAATTGGRR